MGGIQTEPVTQDQFSPTQQMSEEHADSANKLADLLEELARGIRSSKTYQEFYDITDKAEKAYKTIDTGLASFMDKMPSSESAPADVTTGHEGEE